MNDLTVAQGLELKKTARITAILIFSLVLFGPFSMIYVPQKVFSADSQIQLIQNIAANQQLIKLAIAGGMIIFLIEIVITSFIFILLKPVHKGLSVAAAFARLAMTGLQSISILILFLILQAGTTGDSTGVLNLLVSAFDFTAVLWGSFFGLHLLLSGWLVVRSGYIASWVGVGLFLAGICYLVVGFGTALVPESAKILNAIALVSVIELVFPFYLVIKGIRVPHGN